MTNETVIAILSELKKSYLGGIVDALDFAIEAVKAQEPMLVVSKDTNEIIGDCPRCGRHVIHWHNKYCAECGQAVKWDD